MPCAVHVSRGRRRRPGCPAARPTSATSSPPCRCRPAGLVRHSWSRALLANELRDLEESPWNDNKSDTYLTPSKLAKRLKPFGVKPGHNPAKTARGYTLESLRDAFRRYLQPNPSSRPTPGADQHEHDENYEALKRPEASGGVPRRPAVRKPGHFWTASDGFGHFGRQRKIARRCRPAG